MKKNYQLLLLAAMIILLGSCKKNETGSREIIKFTRGWKFILNDNPEFKTADYNDSAWRTLNLPYDWSIEGHFSEENPATPGGGHCPADGTGKPLPSINQIPVNNSSSANSF